MENVAFLLLFLEKKMRIVEKYALLRKKILKFLTSLKKHKVKLIFFKSIIE